MLDVVAWLIAGWLLFGAIAISVDRRRYLRR